MKNKIVNSDTPLYVISDLHLGAGRRDNFSQAQRVNELMDFLSHIEAENGQLVILGDFLDLWRFNLSSILKNHSELLQRFSEIDCIYVPGNHDLAVKNIDKSKIGKFKILDNISEPFFVQIASRNFGFCHGHEVDRLNRYIKPTFGKILGHLAISIEHFTAKQVIDSDSIAEAFIEIEAAITALWATIMFGFDKFLFEWQAIRQTVTELLLQSRNIKKINKYESYIQNETIIINAHTHRAGSFNRCYFNSGSWALGNSDFLRIMPDGLVEVLKWKCGSIAKNDTILA